MQATLPLAAPPRPASPPQRALRVLAGALALGLATQLLFRGAGLGLDWLVWDLLTIAVTIATLRRGPLRPTAVATAGVAALFGAAIVLHRSAFTTGVALPANLVALAALPVIVADDLAFHELGTVPARLAFTFFDLPAAVIHTAVLPRDAIATLDDDGRAIAKRTIAGLLLGVPAAGLFAILLCADTGFASFVSGAESRLGASVSFAFDAILTATGFAFAYLLFAKARAAAPQPSPAIDAPYRSTEALAAAPRVAPLTWAIVVGQVAVVFLIYVLVHRDTEFGGHAVVRGRGITYASHLHAGFYQLLLATVLSVCLVLVGHRLLRAPGDEGPVPGGLALTLVEAALLVLTGLTLFSCAHRLALYEEAYGATHLRVGVGFVVLAAFAVLLCTLAKSLARGLRAFGGATATALAICALAAAFFDADAYVARTNLDRAARGKPLDALHLASLSADACVVADHPVLRAREELRAYVVEAWRTRQGSSDVRALRGLARCPDAP